MHNRTASYKAMRRIHRDSKSTHCLSGLYNVSYHFFALCCQFPGRLHVRLRAERRRRGQHDICTPTPKTDELPKVFERSDTMSNVCLNQLEIIKSGCEAVRGICTAWQDEARQHGCLHAHMQTPMSCSGQRACQIVLKLCRTSSFISEHFQTH